MLKEKFDIKLIAQITAFSIDRITKLQTINEQQKTSILSQFASQLCDVLMLQYNVYAMYMRLSLMAL